MSKYRICINIKRPGWDNVKKAYDEINTASPDNKKLQNIFKQAIMAYGKWRGISESRTKQTAEAILATIESGEYDDFVWQRYVLVGGTPLREYLSYKNFFDKSPDYPDYGNTCALQVSYALNYGGMPLRCQIKKGEYGSMYGRDEELYILGADYMGKLLYDKWGKAEVSIKSNDNGKLTVLKQINNKGGIVVMKGDYSHATLWNIDEFVDVQNLGAEYNFYFNMGTAQLQFWELK